MEYLDKIVTSGMGLGDEYWFKEYFTKFRQDNGVNEAVWKTLNYLYDSHTADLLEFQ